MNHMSIVTLELYVLGLQQRCSGSQLQLTELTCSRSTQELRRRTSEGKPENNFSHKR